MRNSHAVLGVILSAMFFGGTAPSLAVEAAKAGVKTETFDSDPNWSGFNNRIIPRAYPVVVQDFGYSHTHFAGVCSGEMGGQITRAAEPAWYGAKITPKTLDDKLTASGTFAITRTHGGSGICFGWFNGNQPQGMGRPINSLGMMLSGNSAGGRLAVHLVTDQNQVCAKFITRFERYKTIAEKAEMRPTPIKIDGTRYHWKIDYNPAANDGKGQFQFSVKSDEDKPDDFEGKTFTVDLPDGFKKQGTTFDHFGLINITRPGGSLSIYFDDLEYDGQSQDFSQDPNWDSSGNHASYQAKEVSGAHDFGFSPTNHAGGMAGEIGGVIWRSPYAYYATPIGPLSLKDRLEAHGRFVLVSGAPDSGFYFGWFNSATKDVDDAAPQNGRNYLGVEIGGPTRVGHYFLPVCTTAQGGRAAPKDGLVLKRGQAYEWTLLYDPLANAGHGQMRMTLGEESVTFDLKSGLKLDEAVFDRFGMFCVGTGGGQLKAYFDDLGYTAAKP